MKERIDLLLEKERIIEDGRNSSLMDWHFPITPLNMPLMDTAIIDRAIVTWGEEKQYTQLMEECGEVTVEICHTFFRPDRTTPLRKLLEEVVGVRIAVDHVIRLNQKLCEEIYHEQIGKEIAAMDKVAEREELLSIWGPIASI